jgi:hypothetical protein
MTCDNCGCEPAPVEATVKGEKDGAEATVVLHLCFDCVDVVAAAIAARM